MLGGVLAQGIAHEAPLVGAGHPVAAEQLLLARDLEVRDRPRHGQALEQQLGGALPGVLAVEASGEDAGVFAPGARGQRAASGA